MTIVKVITKKIAKISCPLLNIFIFINIIQINNPYEKTNRFCKTIS